LPQQRLLDFLEAPAKQQGAANFSLKSCSFSSHLPVVKECVRAVLDQVFDNLAEAIHAFDCDVVLLSGRPSRLPAVVELLVNKLPVSPDRILPLHEYQAGNWYPFRHQDNRRVGDPKTTTAVGGMLCALAESQLTNFTLFTNRLGLRSTAKFIGEMELSGKLLESKLSFRHNDLDSRATTGDRAVIRYYAPMRLGYRQLPVERWIATPLYRLRLRTGLDTSQLRLPLEITLERSDGSVVDEDAPDALIRSESLKEEFEVREAVDANGTDVMRKIEFVLDTLESEHGYWLDTGILSVA
jgi:hypothetical protein